MKVFGTLIRISSVSNAAPSMIPICPSIIERDHALLIGRHEASLTSWIGPKQAVFVQYDGVLELLDLKSIPKGEGIVDARHCQV